MIEAIPTPQRLVPRPRILILDQPDELKAPFARAYPYGIPKDYNMCRAAVDEIPEKYIEDNLPLGFYTNPPNGAKAIFSTGSGLRAFRSMRHILPRRKLHLWSKNEIQQNCNSIRKVHWHAMRDMSEPLCWDDLWQYFDAFDLYHHGAINLWNIINHLYAENRIIFADVMKTCALELGHWAEEWLKVKGNAHKLKNWETSKGSVIQILNGQDWESLGSLNDAEIPLLTNALKCQRDHLLSPSSIESADPRDLIWSSRSEGGLENWMTGQKTHQRSGLQQHKISETVNTSKTFKPPCIVVDGKHYYDPQTRSTGAVEALKASVEAASSHVVVANGSKVSPPRHPPAERLTVKDDCGAGRTAATSQQTRPNSSDGSTTMTLCSSGSSHSGSPRRMSDSTVRPNHPPSPKIGQGPIVPPGSFAAAGDPAPRVQSPASPPLQHGAANDVSSNAQRQAGEAGTGDRSTLVSHIEKGAPNAQSFGASGSDTKIKSPHRGRRVDSYSSQHNSSPSSRTQHGGFHHGSKPFFKKWTPGFRRQDNFAAFTDSTQKDFASPGMLRADTTINAAGKPACPNSFTAMDRFGYIPCDCFECSLRNRSIWVRVADRQAFPVMDVQTRVRYGVESRFGPVEDVNHTSGSRTSPGPLNFIVRFVTEDSIPLALAHGGGRIEEKGIKINISAMFRSKWVLLPSAFHMGNRPMPQDSIYRVVRAPTQRRGDLPLLQDLVMARGGRSSQRVPSSGGPLMYNNQPFGQPESRQFGQAGPYLGKKMRFSMDTDGTSRGQPPFHAFNPQAQFHGPPVEANSYPNAAPMPGPIHQAQNMLSQPESTAQSCPVAEEATGEVAGATQSAAVPQDGVPSEQNIKPRVSLPERPAAIPTITPTQCQSQVAVDQAVSDATREPPQAHKMPPRAGKSPVRQSKKKRQAAQLRAGNSEVTGPMTAIFVPELASSAAAAASASAQPPAKDKETRRPSLFTDDEIKGRKQAWDRIAVPLISPRKQSLTAEDALLSTKPGHDRAKSLPIAKLAQLTTVVAADQKSAIDAKIELPVPKSAERDTRVGSDAGQWGGGDVASSAAPPSSPKKSGKAGRKKKNNKDSQAKQPAKKEHKL